MNLSGIQGKECLIVRKQLGKNEGYHGRNHLRSLEIRERKVY
ncbi:MAG: hypothetical protein ACXVBP_02930 [Flavisolibacter sp.]